MAGSKSSMVLFMVMMVAAMQMQSSIAQTRHVVGDALGWTIRPNGAYATWASGKTFTVGDSLVFNFTTGVHNVAEVSQAAYGPCTSSNPISIASTGPATIPLTTAGTHYYICTVGTHCSLGQKVSVNVVSAAAAPTTPPAAAPTTPPSAATPTTPPPTATPTPAPVSPPTTTPTPAPAPGPSTTTPTPTSSPAPSPGTAIPPAPPTSGPSPSGSTSPSPAGDNTPTPPAPNSAGRSFTAVAPATLLVAVFALFF